MDDGLHRPQVSSVSRSGGTERVSSIGSRLASKAIGALEKRLPPSTLSRLLERIASSSVLTNLYVSAGATFSGEARAVLSGRAQYAQARAALTRPTYEIRRDTHRLEKGLCSEDRREVFGTAYVA